MPILNKGVFDEDVELNIMEVGDVGLLVNVK
jgi:hypothetical protein